MSPPSRWYSCPSARTSSILPRPTATLKNGLVSAPASVPAPVAAYSRSLPSCSVLSPMASICSTTSPENALAKASPAFSTAVLSCAILPAVVWLASPNSVILASPASITARSKASSRLIPLSRNLATRASTSSTDNPSASSRILELLAMVRTTCCMSQPSLPTTDARRTVWSSVLPRPSDMMSVAEEMSCASVIMPLVAERSRFNNESLVVSMLWARRSKRPRAASRAAPSSIASQARPATRAMPSSAWPMPLTASPTPAMATTALPLKPPIADWAFLTPNSTPLASISIRPRALPTSTVMSPRQVAPIPLDRRGRLARPPVVYRRQQHRGVKLVRRPLIPNPHQLARPLAVGLGHQVQQHHLRPVVHESCRMPPPAGSPPGRWPRGR